MLHGGVSSHKDQYRKAYGCKYLAIAQVWITYNYFGYFTGSALLNPTGLLGIRQTRQQWFASAYRLKKSRDLAVDCLPACCPIMPDFGSSVLYRTGRDYPGPGSPGWDVQDVSFRSIDPAAGATSCR